MRFSSRPAKKHPASPTSWQKVSHWYQDSVGTHGHYYHQHVVLPGVLRLLQLQSGNTLLDLGCGQGVLARHLPDGVEYLGIDASPSLIAAAERQSHTDAHEFRVGDASGKLAVPQLYTHATCILALQNMQNSERAIANMARALSDGGTAVLVLNHPCFRIPRQSSWGVDESKKMQYRRIDRYLSPLKIPVQAKPSQGSRSAVTWSFHAPLQHYFAALGKHGLLVETVEEWASDKESQGRAAKMENRGRSEIPLFLAIKARKVAL